MKMQTTFVQDICNRQTQQTYVTYRRQDDLKNLGSILDEKFPIVLILNRGAHYVQDNELVSDLQDTFLHVQNWQSKCKQFGIKCHFFWRTTVPGHPRCENFAEPVNNLTQIEELVSKYSANDPKYKDYHFTEFKRQNELTLNELQKWSSRIDYQVIDPYPINMLRPDKHRKPKRDRNCLHSYNTGKI